MITLLKHVSVIIVFSLFVACSSQTTMGVDPDNFGSLLNKERARNNLTPLTVSPQLNAAANIHANDMAATNNFSHTSLSGGTPADRVHAQNYSFCYIAENISKGHPSEDEAVKAWMKSRDHRENILSPSATQFGVARSSSNYWVLVLARPCN